MSEEPELSRETAIGLLVAVVIVFVVALVALALGQVVVAAACFGLLVAGWFMLRSRLRRRGR